MQAVITLKRTNKRKEMSHLPLQRHRLRSILQIEHVKMRALQFSSSELNRNKCKAVQIFRTQLIQLRLSFQNRKLRNMIERAKGDGLLFI